jgi:hypothetical protein
MTLTTKGGDMRTIIVALALLLGGAVSVQGQVPGDDWTLAHRAPDGTITTIADRWVVRSESRLVAYLQASVRQVGDSRVRAHSVTLVLGGEFQGGAKETHREYREYDCDEPRMKNLRVEITVPVSETQARVKTEEDQPWQYVFPGQEGDLLRQAVCRAAGL